MIGYDKDARPQGCAAIPHYHWAERDWRGSAWSRLESSFYNKVITKSNISLQKQGEGVGGVFCANPTRR